MAPVSYGDQPITYRTNAPLSSRERDAVRSLMLDEHQNTPVDKAVFAVAAVPYAAYRVVGIMLLALGVTAVYASPLVGTMLKEPLNNSPVM